MQGNDKDGHDNSQTPGSFGNADDAYIFNPSSGLYEPKPHTKEKQICKQALPDVKQNFYFPDSKNNIADTFQAIFAGIGVLVSIFALIFLLKTLLYTAQQLQIAAAGLIDSSQNNVTQTTLNIASQNASTKALHIDQRAWVGIGHAGWYRIAKETRGEPEVAIEFTNAGKTPAKNFRAIGFFYKDAPRIAKVRPVDSEDFRKDFSDSVFDGTDVSAAVLLPNVPSTTIVAFREPFEEENARNQYIFYYIHGRIAYDDIFNVHHWNVFCLKLRLQREFNTPIQTDSCPVHNVMDKEQE